MRKLVLIAALALLPLPASAQLQGHTYSSEDIETGSRIYTRECALCHGANGDDIEGVNLRTGQFLSPLSDEDIRELLRTGIPEVGMPAQNLQPAELDGIVAFIRAGFDPSGVAVRVGNAAAGEAIFTGKGECSSCHRVNGRGPRVAPDLSDIGAIRRPASLQRSLLDPTANMRPINRPFDALTRDGQTFRGRRVNEDTYTVQIVTEDERLVSLSKADLLEVQLGETSPMPSMEGELSVEELADLIAYLLTLRGLE